MTETEFDGLIIIEGPPGQPLMTAAGDVDRLVEACLSSQTDLLLLDAANLPPGFFDLGTGVAGAILQKLRNYRIRLAIVGAAEPVGRGGRFGELMIEERRGDQFGLFAGRDEALRWLCPPAELAAGS